MKKFKVSRKKFLDFIFLFSLFLYLLDTILYSSFYSMFYFKGLYNSLIIISTSLLIFKEILTLKLNFKEIMYFSLVLLLTGLISFNLGGQYAILPLFLFIYSSRNVDTNKIINLAFYESLILFIIIILSAKLGIIYDYIENGSRVRDYLGFRYSLYSQALLFNITALYLYKDINELNLKKCILLIIINLIIFKYTDSRFSF